MQWICYRLCLMAFTFFSFRTSLTVNICEFTTVTFDHTFQILIVCNTIQNILEMKSR